MRVLELRNISIDVASLFVLLFYVDMDMTFLRSLRVVRQVSESSGESLVGDLEATEGGGRRRRTAQDGDIWVSTFADYVSV